MRKTLFRLSVVFALTFLISPCFADEAQTPANTIPATVATETTPAEEAPVKGNVPLATRNSQLATEEATPVEETALAEEAEAEAPVDLTVPENGTPAEYMAFIEKLLQIKRPADQEQVIEHLTKVCKAQVEATNKIIEHKDTTQKQMVRAVNAKITCLKILMQAGDKTAKDQLYGIPEQLGKVNQVPLATEVAMGLMSLSLQRAKESKDYSEIEEISKWLDEKIKECTGDKERLQALYLVKLVALRGLSELKNEDMTKEFDTIVEEIQKAGLTEMVEDIILGKIAQALMESVQKNDKAMFDETAKLVDDILKRYGKNINQDAALIAFQTAFSEEMFDAKSAAARYAKYAELCKDVKDEKVAEVAKKMEGSAKRLNLLGNEMTLSGKALDGTDFNLADMKGKVVLVNFWTASVRPCLEEFQFLFQAYPFYKDKGFEIISISLDDKRDEVAEMVKEVEFPWINVWDKDAKSGDAITSESYGIIAIPCMILIGKDGKVLSLDARGETLKKLLTEQLGELPKVEAQKDIDVLEETSDNEALSVPAPAEKAPENAPETK